MKSKVRVCIVGAGGMASGIHYPTLTSFDDVEIAGATDMIAERLHATADKFDIPKENRYEATHPSDYQKMIEKVNPDGVYVIGVPNMMYDIWVWCLQQGLNLFIEKPMGTTLHQAQMLVHLAEKNGCITQVGLQRRNSPIMVKVREECLKYGPITQGVCEMHKNERIPYLGAGGNMMNDCIHSVDTLRWICGGEVIGIESHCKRIETPDISWISAMVHFDNGSTGFIISNWCTGRRVWRMQMHSPGICTDVEIEGKAHMYADGDYEGVEYDTKEVAGSDDLFIYAGYQSKHREFVDSLLAGREMTSSPFRDAVKSMELAEMILAKATLNRE